jgi:drug/metabolite transporter (DMT)-like permease
MLAWLSYLTVSVVWGSTFLAIAYAIEAFTPFGLSAARFLPAGMIALIIGWARKERFPSLRELPDLAIVGVLLLTVCMALIAWAEGQVSSGIAATLAASVPLFLGLMEPDGLEPRSWAGLAVGFLGVLLLLRPSGSSPNLAGSAFLLVSAAIWAFGTLYGRRHARQGGHFSQVGVEMLTAGLVSLSIAPFAGGFTHAPLRLQSLVALAYLILFGSILAYSAYIFLARVWPPAKAGTYAYWNPVVGVLLGCGIRKETFQARMLPALFLILLGVGLVQIPWESILGTRLGARRREGSVSSS